MELEPSFADIEADSVHNEHRVVCQHGGGGPSWVGEGQAQQDHRE